MLVVEEEDTAGAERRGDTAGERLRRAQPPQRAMAEVDEIPAAEQELRRERVDVGVHPGQLGARRRAVSIAASSSSTPVTSAPRSAKSTDSRPVPLRRWRTR